MTIKLKNSSTLDQAIIKILINAYDLEEIKNNRENQKNIFKKMEEELLYIEYLSESDFLNLRNFFQICYSDITTAYFQAVFKGDKLPSDKKFVTQLSDLEIQDTLNYINKNADLKAKFVSSYGKKYEKMVTLKTFWEITGGQVVPSFRFPKMYALLKDPVFKPSEAAMKSAVKVNQK